LIIIYRVDAYFVYLIPSKIGSETYIFYLSGKDHLLWYEDSVGFSEGIQRVIYTGQRFNIPVHIDHSAKVGENGCGMKIEKSKVIYRIFYLMHVFLIYPYITMFFAFTRDI
jgi:hypothetical protein